MSQPSHVRVLHPVPVRSLTAQVGELVDEARGQVERLAATLRRLDDVRATLLEQEHMDVQVDLGEVGNAAADARRRMGLPGHVTFELPR